MLRHDEREWIEKRFDRIEIAIAELRVKCGYWGVMGGAATVLVAIGIYIATRG